MDVDNAFDVLTEEVCRHLLANERVGRLGFVDGAGFPVVVPVNYVVDGDRIVIRTDAGAKLDGVPLRPVAFEVEHLAPAYHGGWSVLVQGFGQDVTNAVGAPYEQLRALRMDTWAPGPKEHWLTVDITRISGRRLRPSDEPDRG